MERDTGMERESGQIADADHSQLSALQARQSAYSAPTSPGPYPSTAKAKALRSAMGEPALDGPPPKNG